MFSDLTLGPSFKVKRWFTGFGELSFRWIQICIGSPMRRSSYMVFYVTCGTVSVILCGVRPWRVLCFQTFRFQIA